MHVKCCNRVRGSRKKEMRESGEMQGLLKACVTYLKVEKLFFGMFMGIDAL